MSPQHLRPDGPALSYWAIFLTRFREGSRLGCEQERDIGKIQSIQLGLVNNLNLHNLEMLQQHWYLEAALMVKVNRRSCSCTELIKFFQRRQVMRKLTVVDWRLKFMPMAMKGFSHFFDSGLVTQCIQTGCTNCLLPIDCFLTTLLVALTTKLLHHLLESSRDSAELLYMHFHDLARMRM